MGRTRPSTNQQVFYSAPCLRLASLAPHSHPSPPSGHAVDAACNLTAYSFGALPPSRSIQRMSLKGMATTPPPPTSGPRREDALQEAAEPTTRLQALQKMAATISLLPAAGTVVTGAGGGLGFPAEAQAAKGAAAGEVRMSETHSCFFHPTMMACSYIPWNAWSMACSRISWNSWFQPRAEPLCRPLEAWWLLPCMC